MFLIFKTDDDFYFKRILMAEIIVGMLGYLRHLKTVIKSTTTFLFINLSYKSDNILRLRDDIT